MTLLASTDLNVHPLCLGGNVFGWTADEAESFAVLDAYAAAGGNFIDTADIYSGTILGDSGEYSEVVIGRWLARRGRSDDMVIATKVGMHPQHPGLSADNIRTQVETSLRQLGMERIPLLYAHVDDPGIPLEETLGAFDALVKEGKVGHIAASNYSAARLREALDVSEREGLAAYVAIQPHYNLVERDGYEGEEADLVTERGLACMPYYSLAKGFLTGKYRPDGAKVDSTRAEGAMAYMDERGRAVLGVLNDVAAAHEVPVASVALAWLAAQPTVASPIASARTVEQLQGLLPMAELTLSPDEMTRLTAASDTGGGQRQTDAPGLTLVAAAAP